MDHSVGEQVPDPLFPAAHRLPRVSPPTGADEPSSASRPFILRGLPVGNLPTSRHRTPATQRKIPQPTTMDGKNPKVITDYYTTPDD